MAACGRWLAEGGAPALTIGLTVPARGFSAAFAAAAAALTREEIDPMTPGDSELHLATLRETAVGTPLKFHTEAKIFDGRWKGIGLRNGTEMLTFETRQGVTRMLPLDAALNIRLTGEAASARQLQARQVQTPPLLNAMIGASAALTYTTTARTDCLIVGTQTLLEEELTSETFYARSRRGGGGVLQDLVRARDLAGARRYFRTIIVPSATGPATAVREAEPHLVIFDGGRAYLRWRKLWPGARQLVIVDRSLSSAEDAASELSMAFIERVKERSLPHRLKVPAGVEAICFERQT
jgi:hypothetical protein